MSHQSMQAEQAKQAKQIYEFGPYRLDVAERLLWRDGEVVPLQPKIFDLLLALVERHGRLVGKDELMTVVWPDTVVEEANLTNNISTLRKTLGENGDQYIETMPKRGYRFVAPVKELNNESVEPVVAEAPRAQIAVAAEQEIDPDDRPGAPNPVRPKRWRAILTSRRLLALVALIVVGCGFWVASIARQPAAPVEKMPRSIAVLPFIPLSANDRDEAMELGMAETLISKLSGLHQVIVRPISSVRKYQSLEQDPIAAGRELGVEAVLTCTFQRRGERIRVTARLLSVSDGSSLREYQCNDYCTDIFTAQDAISERIAEALAHDLTGEERKMLAKRYTENIEAYHLYLKGRQLLHQRVPSAIEKSIEYFQQAIDLDPGFAPAYAGQGYSYLSLSHLAVSSPKEVMPKAKAAIERALQLDDQLAEAHTYLANFKGFYEWDFPGAEREYIRAIELNPNSADAHNHYALYLMTQARFDEALAQIKKAEEFDPLSPFIGRNIGMILYFARRYDEAIAQLQQVVKLYPDNITAYKWIGHAYEQKGLEREAATAFLTSDGLSGAGQERIAALRSAFAAAGIKGYWRKRLELALARERRQYLDPFDIALSYVRLGEREQALAWLQKAYEERALMVGWLKVYPTWDGFRSDPRFVEIVRRIGLTP